MLEQEKMIQKVIEKSQQDELVVATMMYGSFTQGSGDQYSDIEFYIFVKDDEFESRRWVEDIEPCHLYFKNEFGSEVAIFKNLVRGEFHFLPEKEMQIIESFRFVGYFPDVDSMLLYDETGKLAAHLAMLKNIVIDRNEEFEGLWHNFINIILMGMNILNRGEQARALEWLGHVQRYILQMARIKEQQTHHWVNPTKNLEQEIKEDVYEKYRLCTASLNEKELYSAYRQALQFGKELMVEYDEELIEKLEVYFNSGR